MKREKSVEFYQDFCCGCGLCSEEAIDFCDTKSFCKPELSEDNKEFCNKYCLANHKFESDMWKQGVWGKYNTMALGFATNVELRHRSSSGGVISALLIYMLNTGLVHGVIHTAADPRKPWRTKTFCSTTEDEIIQRCGSRYAQSSPLKDLVSYLEPGKKYVYVGKPCDVLALKKYMADYKEINEQIICCISFFCAGVPSERANQKLIKSLGCKLEDCAKLSYRGNGWPGKSIVKTFSNQEFKMDYNTSWGKILGRDIRKICRFCMIGTGEYADISCGDAWYLDNAGYPDFKEHKGRNVIITRTSIGEDLLNKAVQAKYVKLIGNCKKSLLTKMQPYQYERKGTMFEKVSAMKILRRECPNISLKMLKSLKAQISYKRRWAIFKGTIGRIIRNKI